MTEPYIHPTAEVHSASIGEDTRIWQNTVVLSGAEIGREVNICAHCFVENDVTIGDRVTVKCGVYLWDGVSLGDDVFIGANVTFINDNAPRSKQYPAEFLRTIIEQGATVGSGAVLLGGITVGRGAMIGAGSVVTKTVPPYAIVKGNPARITGYTSSAELPGVPAMISRKADAPITEGTVSVGIGDVTLHRLRFVQDMRGKLSVGEFPIDIPFAPQRYFLVYGVPTEKTRGEHAHHCCKQFLVCVNGGCAVVVDNGSQRAEVVLNSPDIGLYLPPLIWGIQYKFTQDAVLLVFASEKYDSNDYIRDYKQFLHVATGRKK